MTGKWLAKFSTDIQGSLPDIPDTMASVSGLSGPHLENPAETTSSQAERFSTDIPQSRTDKTDTLPVLPSVSVMSVPHLENPAKITPAQPDEIFPNMPLARTDNTDIRDGDRITWTRAGQVRTGVVDFIHVDDTGTQWVFTAGQSWAAINSKFVRLASKEDVAAATNRAAPSCFSCGSTERWLSIHGAIVCVVCHPPAHPSLIKAWLGPDDHGDGDDDAVINGDEEPFDVGPA